MKNSSVQPLGVYEITLKSADGQIKKHFFSKNLVVQTGKNIIASLLVADYSENSGGEKSGGEKPYLMQVGKSTEAVSVDDIALKSPVDTNPVALTSANRINNQVTYTATFGMGVAVGTLHEVGIIGKYNGEDVLFSRSVFPTITKEPDDELTIRWAITIA